jgi:hypothetical protein
MDDFGNRIYHKIRSYQYTAAMAFFYETDWDCQHYVIF